MKFNRKFEEIVQTLSKIDNERCQVIKEELMELSKVYQKKNDRVDRIIKLSDTQQKAILQLHEELDSYKNHLEERVLEEVAKREAQELQLIEQSRLASIAEMMDAVAHQWKQPLNMIMLYMNILKMEAKRNNGISVERLEVLAKTVTPQIDHLVETLDVFRSFFRPAKEAASFSVYAAVEAVLSLMKDDLVAHTVSVETVNLSDFEVSGNENEFRHILINLISNAKYAFEKRRVQERKITIVIDGEKKMLRVQDNAGGIDEAVIERIFDMNVTTKGEEGTGIGLYMSQKIAKKHKGELVAHNMDEGAAFVFRMKEDQHVA